VRNLRTTLLLIALAVALAGATARTQPPVPGNQRFRTGVEVISVNATVTDATGHLVTGLPRESFELYEDGVQQTITQFSNDRVPVGLGLLLDVSDSMFGRRIQDARTAVERFLLDLLTPDDEFFIMAFNHRPRVLTGWTMEPDLVRRTLEALRPSGGTAVYDAIVQSLPLIAKRSRQRAALVVISDGADTASDATLRDIRTALLRSDAFVYAVAIDSPERQPINTRVNPAALREITAESGGRTEIVQNSADLTSSTESIAHELNSQYLLGYSSIHATDGQYHSIRVKVSGSGLKVRARNGYVGGTSQR
jgi:Ca-activated chloride channel family protein